MKMPAIFLFMLITLSALVSCVDSSDLKPEIPFYQYYSAQYDKNDGTMKAESYFRTRSYSGTDVTLNGASSVTCNGKKPELFITYDWDFDKKQDLTFVLKKENGSTFTNVIRANTIPDITIPTSFETIFKSTDNTFTWEGKPLGANEKLMIKLDQGDDLRELIIIDNAAGVKSAQITKANLTEFKEGLAEIIVERFATGSLTEVDQSAGGLVERSIVTRKVIQIKK